MSLLCPICGTALAPDDISVARAVATCSACGAVTSVDRFGSRGSGTRAAPAPARRNRRAVPRPDHFSVRDDGSRLRIRFCWIWRRFTGPAMMCFLWSGFLVGWYWSALRTERPMMWISLIFTIPHTAVGLLLVYGTLAGLLNQTVITVTSEFLTVRNGPVPWWGNRRVPTDELERLYCCKESDSAERGWEDCVYGVTALTKGADKVELVTDLDGDQALFIQQELERWLKIGAHGVGAQL
jgi:hypothetical protein